MNLKRLAYLSILVLTFSCSNKLEEKGVREAYSEDNGINKIEADTIENLSKDKFDSSFFIGTWRLRSSDLKVLDYSYIETMPVSFDIVALDQIRYGALTARFGESRYPFHLNRIEEDSSLIYLHPAECKCEGLEVGYVKE